MTANPFAVQIELSGLADAFKFQIPGVITSGTAPAFKRKAQEILYNFDAGSILDLNQRNQAT